MSVTLGQPIENAPRARPIYGPYVPSLRCVRDAQHFLPGEQPLFPRLKPECRCEVTTFSIRRPGLTPRSTLSVNSVSLIDWCELWAISIRVPYYTRNYTQLEWLSPLETADHETSSWPSITEDMHLFSRFDSWYNADNIALMRPILPKTRKKFVGRNREQYHLHILPIVFYKNKDFFSRINVQ